MKPIDNFGETIDANYSVIKTEDGFLLTLESRGGGKNGPRAVRNGDYGTGLTYLLERMASRGMILQNIQLASSRAMRVSPEARILKLDDHIYPIYLSQVKSADHLRRSIGRASSVTLQKSGAKGGNNNKRIGLRIVWTQAGGISAEQIENFLAFPDIHIPIPDVVDKAPTDDPQLLEERVSRVRAKFAQNINGGPVPIPSGSDGKGKVESTTVRFIRDPEIVAWILHNANGICEGCNAPAPFIKSDGFPYLEVHHVRPLVEGGPDKVDNAIGICPNCHRGLHYGTNRVAQRATIIAKTDRLVDHPVVSIQDDE